MPIRSESESHAPSSDHPPHPLGRVERLWGTGSRQRADESSGKPGCGVGSRGRTVDGLGAPYRDSSRDAFSKGHRDADQAGTVDPGREFRRLCVPDAP